MNRRAIAIKKQHICSAAIVVITFHEQNKLHTTRQIKENQPHSPHYARWRRFVCRRYWKQQHSRVKTNDACVTFESWPNKQFIFTAKNIESMATFGVLVRFILWLSPRSNGRRKVIIYGSMTLPCRSNRMSLAHNCLWWGCFIVAYACASSARQSTAIPIGKK